MKMMIEKSGKVMRATKIKYQKIVVENKKLAEELQKFKQVEKEKGKGKYLEINYASTKIW